jgi:hypothetical protein
VTALTVLVFWPEALYIIFNILNMVVWGEGLGLRHLYHFHNKMTPPEGEVILMVPGEGFEPPNANAS